MKRGGRSVTLRSGTSERNWYLIAGYVFLGVGGTLFAFYQLATADSGYGTNLAGATLSTVIIAMVLLSVPAFAALFRDSAYVRGTSRRWYPRWWIYIGTPIGIGVAVMFVADMANFVYGGPIAMLIYSVLAPVSCGYYLYNRHNTIGVP